MAVNNTPSLRAVTDSDRIPIDFHPATVVFTGARQDLIAAGAAKPRAPKPARHVQPIQGGAA